jgi:glycosyltransferase involved in cell wall biosynthesis
MERVKVSVIVPTMNEERSIGLVLQEIKDVLSSSPYSYEILVVDTLSKDRTVEIAEKMGARVIQEERRGYGRAYMTGFAAAKGEYIATLDADLTYPADVIPRLVQRLEEGLDFISCERMSLLTRDAMEPAHRLGNTLLNLAVRVLYGIRLKDSQSGMWVFRREVLDRLHLTNWGMPFSEEIKLEAVQKGLRFAEVPIRYRPRVGDAKLRSWADGWANLRYLIQRRLRR